MFSRFFRASTATRHAIRAPASGLRSRVRSIEQHGGTIAFTSREGEGTDVMVTLPATA